MKKSHFRGFTAATAAYAAVGLFISLSLLFLGFYSGASVFIPGAGPVLTLELAAELENSAFSGLALAVVLLVPFSALFFYLLGGAGLPGGSRRAPRSPAEKAVAGSVFSLFSLFIGFYSGAHVFASVSYELLAPGLIRAVHEAAVSTLASYSAAFLPLSLLFFYALSRAGTRPAAAVPSLRPAFPGVRAGFGLVEAMISIFLLAVLSLSVAYMHRYLQLMAVRTMENTSSTRLSASIFEKLKSIEYYYLFPYDSAQANYGLAGTYGPVTQQQASYPYLGLLDEITAIAARYSIDRWTVEMKFKIRDVSDVTGDGLTGDLRDFTDADGDLVDDYDPAIRYYKANADADYYDTYVSTVSGKTVSELPDTNLKEVTLRLYKRGRLLHSRTELISLEMLSGIESRASGAELKMLIEEPANDTFLYDLTDAGRATSFAVGISSPYPAEVTAYRADAGYPLRLKGETAPLANAGFYVNTMSAVSDSRSADASGLFDFQSLAVTSALTEGENLLYAKATKDSYYSPFAQRRLVLDLNPPQISSQSPSGTVPDLMPYVGAVLSDAPLSPGAAVSGICPETVSLRVNGAAVPFDYDQATGRVSWRGTDGLPNKLANGSSYTVTAEGGDRAYYKIVSTWTFTVSVSDPDPSQPSIAQMAPQGANVDPLPEIGCRLFDNQSGIDPYSIELRLDGELVVSSGTISGHWDPETGRLSYYPPAEFVSGSAHTVEVRVSHWAVDPPEKRTSVQSWNFTVKYY
jgi:hypothetical protein